MSETRAALLREHRDGVAWLTLNRPEKRNALNDALISELKDALRDADNTDSVRAIALRGAGKDFCSGADLSALEKISGASVAENLQDVDSLAELFLLIRHTRKPVVALVHGRALAGGCGLATACDLVLASASARFGYTETRIGFVPAMVMAILRRSISEKRAFELLVRGEQIDTIEAERIGLINQVFDDAPFISESERYVREIAQMSASAVQLCKRLLYHQDGMSFETALRAGADMNVLARMTEDTRAGVARFLDR
ncbi:MAG TPA: enoyl-CoA hydratase-related protein [Longimicrobiaceae bacterium]|nr:enoyl-CoA hydratase-related protein [Longimicrobiaceae bacterium]